MDTSLIEQIAAKAALLPLEQQRLALQFIESLGKSGRMSKGSPTPRHLRLKGCAMGEGPRLTLEDLQDARKEMWGKLMETDE